MAKQASIFTVEGKVGNASFFKTSKRGFQVRQKGGVSAARMATDPKFENTRKNGQEFGRAGKANRLFRDAFTSLLKNGSDGSLSRRLTALKLKIVQADPVRPFGERIVLVNNLTPLDGFDCNADALLSANFSASFDAAIDRAGGKLSVTIPSFVPKAGVTWPMAATHYKLVIGSAEMDYANGKVVSGNQQLSDAFPLDNNATVALNLQAAVTPNSTLPLILVFGIQYFIMKNNNLDPVGNGKSNPLKVVKISLS